MKTHSHVVEIYALHGTEIGALRTRFQLEAVDSKEALVTAAEQFCQRHEIVVVYQGNLDGWIARPTGFCGGYTLPEWASLRDRYSGVEGVLQVLKKRSAETK